MGILKNYEELLSKRKDKIKTITNKSDDHDEKFMKIKSNLDDGLPLNKTLELHNMRIVVRAVFHEDNKYYPEAFLDDCLYIL